MRFLGASWGHWAFADPGPNLWRPVAAIRARRRRRRRGAPPHRSTHLPMAAAVPRGEGLDGEDFFDRKRPERVEYQLLSHSPNFINPHTTGSSPDEHLEKPARSTPRASLNVHIPAELDAIASHARRMHGTTTEPEREPEASRATRTHKEQRDEHYTL